MIDALNGANINVGANTVNIGPQSAVIRSVGQIRSMDDIRHTMLVMRDGAPVLVGDVATITVGYEPRLGIAGHDGDNDIVEGIVLMRRGAETLPTLRAVKQAVAEINALGPAAARREDRAHLRPQRAGRRHDPHRAAQHGDGRLAHLLHPVAVPRRPAQRPDRVGHHSRSRCCSPW